MLTGMKARLTSSRMDLTTQLHVAGLDGIPIVISVNPRATRMRVRIDAARRRVVATTPSLRHRLRLERFLAEQQGFIRTHWHALGPARPFSDGAVVTLFGETLTLRHDGTRSQTRRKGPDLIVGGPQDGFADKVRRYIRNEARHWFEARSQTYAHKADRTFSAVRVGDAGTRWGSCSSRGVLTYSWRLALAPQDVAEYVAAHEVAHLVHPDHSAAFWAENARLLGHDPRPRRRWLRQHGASLFAWGAAI